MKTFVALLVLVAIASGKSFYPGFPYTTGYTGMYPGSHVINPYTTGFTGLNGFTGLPQRGFYNPIQQRVFKREAESDSDSFYPGYPFVPPYSTYGATPYGPTPFSPYTASLFTPYHNPMVRPAVYNTYPQVYTPMKQTEQKVEVEQRQKRESDSDSFYPGYPFVAPYTSGYTPYGATPFTPYTASPYTPYYNPIVRPAVQYASHPMAYNPLLKLVEDKKEVKPVEVEQRQKRESASDSFYPGYPYTAPYTTPFGYNVSPYSFGHPAVPYTSFPHYNYPMTVQTFRTAAAIQEQKEQQ